MPARTVSFRPRRVLAVDLATGRIQYPDPEAHPHHPDARVLVIWCGDPIGMVDVTVPDADVVPAVRRATWEQLGPAIMAAATRRGAVPPRSIEDLTALVEDVEQSLHVASDSPFVTVTIASFRNIVSTVDSVRRVLAGCWRNLEVVVVDNDVDPEPLGRALRQAFSGEDRVRWVHEPRQGLSFARNAGLAAARGDITVFTDDDVWVDPHWVERLVTAFDAGSGPVACVTGAILPAELETQAQLWLEEYGGFHKGFERRVFDATQDPPESPLYPYNSGQFGSGANMAFRTGVLRELGGFAVDLGAGTPAHGGEDLDVFMRTVTAGHTIVYEPAALMWHRHRRSLAALRRQMFRYGIGLSATVTRWVLQDRRTAVAILRRLPAGLVYLLSPGSDKNRSKTTTFPRLLTALELGGVLLGPLAYLRSRRHVRRVLMRRTRTET